MVAPQLVAELVAQGVGVHISFTSSVTLMRHLVANAANIEKKHGTSASVRIHLRLDWCRASLRGQR